MKRDGGRVKNPIGFADVFRVLELVEPKDDEWQAIAIMLGLRAERERPKGRDRPQRRSGVQPPHIPRAPASAPVLQQSPSSTSAPSSGPAFEIEIQALERRPVLVPSWAMSVEPLPRHRVGQTAWLLESLLEPQGTRAMLGAALATASDHGSPLTEELVDAVARLQVPRRIPRARVPTLRRGVQVLIERGNRMLPHFRDAEVVLRQLDGIIANGAMQVVYFDDDPTRVHSPESIGLVPYVPPPPGTPVLALSMLGTDEEHAAPLWLRFADNLRRRASQMIALIPRGPGAIPSALARRIVTIPWDRSTSIASVSRALARAGARG